MSKGGRRRAEARGRRAETLAAIFLMAKGYRILEKRYKVYGGEIDIIAKRGNVLAIIEVKQRADIRAAHESLYPAALARIEDAASQYQGRHSFAQNMDMRFDAVFVLPRFKILHIKDAWRVD